MKRKQNDVLESLHHVQAFLDDNAPALAGIMDTGMRHRLRDAVTELTLLVTVQGASGLVAKGATRKQRALRTALRRDHMAPIASIARVEMSDTPQLAAFRMPKTRVTAQALCDAADAMADAAAPFNAQFIAAGRSVDFLAQLTDATEAVMESTRSRAATWGRQSGATAGLGATLTLSRRLVAALDTFVKSALCDDPVLLVGWEAARHVRRPARVMP